TPVVQLTTVSTILTTACRTIFCRCSASRHTMKRWGLRASSLSAVTKANAGQNTSCNHLNPNVLYMMLPAVIYIFLSIKYSIHTQHFINVFNVLFLSSLIFSIQYSFLHCQQN